MMKNRTKIAIAGVAVGALAVTAMALNKHPEKETQMPAEETLTEVTPDTEEKLTEMSPEPEIKTEEYESDAFYISHISHDIFEKM